jgi:hypothetical protein
MKTANVEVGQIYGYSGKTKLLPGKFVMKVKVIDSEYIQPRGYNRRMELYFKIADEGGRPLEYASGDKDDWGYIPPSNLVTARYLFPLHEMEALGASSLDPALQAGLKRLQKKAYPKSMKEAKLVLDHLGIILTPIKEGRSTVGYAYTFPAGAPMRSYEGRFRRPDPQRAWTGGSWSYPDEKAAQLFTVWLPEQAAQALGSADPAAEIARLRESQGLPEIPRDLDPAVRTCGACFRDIKATSGYGKRSWPYLNKIVDHGYTIRSGWRQGSCWGVNRLPLEESREALEIALKAHEEYSKKLVTQFRLWRDAVAGKPPAVKKIGPITTQRKEYMGYGKGDWSVDPHSGSYRYVPEVHQPGSSEWEREASKAFLGVKRDLKDLWSGSFASIPWYRAAWREWQPQAPEVVPAKGAPYVKLQKGDYRGKPSVLSNGR